MKNQTAVCIALLTLWLGAAAQTFAQLADTPEALDPCPYTPAEIKTALGLNVGKGEVADMRFPDSRDVACSYQTRRSFIVFTVRQTWDLPPISASGNGPQPVVNGRRLRQVAGDADHAIWEETVSPGERRLKLTYYRGRVGTTVEIYGGMFHEGGLRPLLLALRRVP